MISFKKHLSILAGASIGLFLLTACSAVTLDVVGTWGEDAEGQPHLVFEDEGKLYGTDGCNRLTGSWEQDGEIISFGQTASTMMACPDVDTWLKDLHTAQIDSDTLLINDAAGAQIGSLTKASQ